MNTFFSVAGQVGKFPPRVIPGKNMLDFAVVAPGKDDKVIIVRMTVFNVDDIDEAINKLQPGTIVSVDGWISSRAIETGGDKKIFVPSLGTTMSRIHLLGDGASTEDLEF